MYSFWLPLWYVQTFFFTSKTTKLRNYVICQGLILEIDINIYFSAWLSDSCLTPTHHFFCHIMARTSKFSIRWWCGPLCTRLTCLVGFCIVLTHWNNSPRIDMSPHSDTWSWLVLLLLNAACIVEKQECWYLMSSYYITCFVTIRIFEFLFPKACVFFFLSPGPGHGISYGK